jgi:hypothetical protein
MTFTRFSSLIMVALLWTSLNALAQTALTDEQRTNVLKQLDELEKSILQQRETSLSPIINQLRASASSDTAALNFMKECDELVNVKWKEGDSQDKKQVEQREAKLKRQTESDSEETEKNGDDVLALRITLEYLALSLEAYDSKDFSEMVPKLTAYHQSLLSAGEKLHGRAGVAVMQSLTAGGPQRADNKRERIDLNIVIKAFQLSRYLDLEDWSYIPGDIVGQYMKTIIKQAKSKDKLFTLWDAALNTEASFRKARLFPGEFTAWHSSEYPLLRWQRAIHLKENGADPVQGMAEMLKVIKEYPKHADAQQWVAQLRQMVQAAAP